MANKRSKFAFRLEKLKFRPLTEAEEQRWKDRFNAKTVGLDERVAQLSRAKRRQFTAKLNQPSYFHIMEEGEPGPVTIAQDELRNHWVAAGQHKLDDLGFVSLMEDVADAISTVIRGGAPVH